jgi:hypothetical protein
MRPHTQVVMLAIASRMMMPGIIPSVSKTRGIESTPSPICVFIIRIAVPIQPTCFAHKNGCSIGNREWYLHLYTVRNEKRPVSIPFNDHVKLGDATYIRSTFLNVTKNSISDTNASATRTEAALYDFTILLRRRLGKVVQPLIVFVFRHCDRTDRVQVDVGERKVKRLWNELVRAGNRPDFDEGAM